MITPLSGTRRSPANAPGSSYSPILTATRLRASHEALIICRNYVGLVQILIVSLVKYYQNFIAPIPYTHDIGPPAAEHAVHSILLHANIFLVNLTIRNLLCEYGHTVFDKV